MYVEPESETKDGAPSTESALEASETDGEGRGASILSPELAYVVDVMLSGRVAGRANERG